MSNPYSPQEKVAAVAAFTVTTAAIAGAAIHSTPLPQAVYELAVRNSVPFAQLLTSEVLSGLAGALIGAGLPLAGELCALRDGSRVESVKIQSEQGGFEAVNAPERKHALLILGDPQGRPMKVPFSKTGKLIYEALTARGFSPSDIYLLAHESKLDFASGSEVMPATKRKLEETVAHLSKTVSSKDLFFLYVLSHGVKEGVAFPAGSVFPAGESGFCLEKEGVNETELERVLSGLQPQYSVLYFNNCFGGGFAKKLGKGRTVAISTSRQNKVSWQAGGSPVNRYATPFTYFFFSAFRGSFPDGTPVTVRPSIEAAFDYAAEQQQGVKTRVQSLTSKLLWASHKNTPHLVYGAINPSQISL